MTIITSLTVLGLDMSSTTIGWVLLRDGSVADRGLIALPAKASIADRCRLARAGVGLILTNHPDVGLVGIESPAAAKVAGKTLVNSLIPQCRVAGAVLSRVSEAGLLDVEVTPSAAKRRLSGDGAVGKAPMLYAAARRFGYAQIIAHKTSKAWIACDPETDRPLYTEHEADALAVALVAADTAVLA